MVTFWLFRNASVALSVLTTQGMPSSREMMAAWQVFPPLLVMMAEAILIIGSQSGSVISVTRTFPSLKEPISWAERMTWTLPCPIFDPTLLPLARIFPCSNSRNSSRIWGFFWLWIVSGLAWTIYRWLVRSEERRV